MKLHSLALLLGLAFGSASALSAPVSGIDFSGFDRSVRIQDDLFSAVNGQWVKTTSIPGDHASYGAFNKLRDDNEARSRQLIEQVAKAPSASKEERKLADLYLSFMDVKSADQRGLSPLSGQLAQIAGADSLPALTRLLGQLQAAPIELPISVSVDPDAANPGVTLLQLNQDGLGLPDRDYYLQNDARFVAARQAYQGYLTQLFTLAGMSHAAERATAVLTLETRIAQAQWDNVTNRDPIKTYNPMSRAQLQKTAPGIDWQIWFAAAGVGNTDKLNLTQPSYVKALGELLHDTPLPVWRDYLTIRLLDGYAPFLSKPFVDAHFALHQQALSGVKEQRARWKNGVSLVERSMGEALGKLYVAQYFPPEAKARMDELVHNLMQAYQQSIDKLSWMTPATRQAAQEKLSKYQIKIGYPAKWRDYGKLQIDRHDLAGNVLRASQFAYQYRLSKLGRPVDRTEWQMTPQTVNAYYDPSLNEIVFPAGILQPPFFNARADEAVNYGAIGAVIGHEISHGFDDQGSQFDGDGKLRNWWTPEDRSRFDALTSKLVAQYDAYEPLPGKHINGKLTLGENIADNAGLQIAYKAYHLSLGGKPAAVIDRLTGDQRFFIGFAQVWRSKIKDQALLKLLVTDPHSPAAFRPQGAAVNTDGFYDAFEVKAGDKMFKPQSERIHLW
ncbi:M13 family peptidase [Paludibacterium sp. THUN1379]|uniref:M13 family metallopeptidase n=1 Tax=Paludibacterium sp. THUN1379 TaxID=3112107 RepID=UPI0030903E7D|nr:M13 family peptidase [Paludibacterium sp. THUN1379]